ncbi:hypothetical protein [Lentzea kentuckyensis]|uniref:hypothetical protein n=1 Tax=Lentzea kentuckyensis TaxID=360086 RepID=UPI000A385D5A|nr:hypothetical protein [Lentzea kentuckyensis]
MNIEDELRGALYVPAPPPTTRLEDVLASGRRRVLGRRAGIAGGVLAVVAAIGIGMLALPSGPPGAADPVNWARATAAPGQPADPSRRDRICQENATPPPVLAQGGETLAAEQMRAWRDLAQSVLPDRRVDSAHPELAENDLTQVFTVDVEGTATLRFSRVRFEGSAFAAADRALWATGACAPPRRTTNGDGTVFQLYDATPQAQSLYVFRADGRVLRLDQVNVAGSRGTLPLKEAEFVKLGAAVAEVL